MHTHNGIGFENFVLFKVKLRAEASPSGRVSFSGLAGVREKSEYWGNGNA